MEYGNWRRAMADVAVCTGFEPQNYLRDRCKKCFRLKSKHEEEEKPAPQSPTMTSPPGSSRGSSYRSIEKRRSFKEKGLDHDDADADDLVSVSSYTSATSKGLSSAKSMESIADTRSMVTAVSGSEVDRGQTPTENDPSLVISIADELAFLREENRQLKEERDRWTLRRRVAHPDEEEEGGGNLVKMLEERLNEAENCIQDYRDENTVLKCELRELQENTYTGEENKLAEKLKTTENLCDEMMEENEALKAEVKDLQTEIEEMQDQYREEEIDEFRELQRELEQHAKNSRVLQFKLRKSERAREQMEAESNLLRQKIEEAAKPVTPVANGHVMKGDENARIKELESELKIAKEVSVRLHGELEQTEEKRYRLEDEVFYLKEKIREMQTQNKWREARNKTETAVKRLSAELNSAPQLLPTDDMSKELRDALEREIDLREQLRFSEEDLKRKQIRLQDIENENEVLLKKLAKTKAGKLNRPPMIRSASEGNAQVQLELAEHEVEHLSTKVDRLEKTNDCLTQQIAALASDSTKKAAETSAQSSGLEKKRFQLTPEMERDMSNLISTIAELEKKNRELTMQLKKGDELMRRREEPDDPVATTTMSSDLRSEQERRRGVEAELSELKATLLKTDNQKLIALATKVEVLQNQLSLANERSTSLHRKHSKDGEMKYADDLKERCEKLEKQLSEQKAAETVADLQGKVPTSDEIESCCEMLASVEAQTSRICKQIERIDLTQKEERRRSLSKESGAAIIAELANVMGEMRNVHGLLDQFKSSSGLSVSHARRSPFRELNASPNGECANCKIKDDEAEKQKQEIVFYKKKNKDLTEQVLQTEDRWTIEIEKQRQIFENEIKTLGVKLADARRQFEETNTLLDGRTTALAEKTKRLEEQCDRNNKLQRDLDEREKKALDQETERKSAKEYEIKYKKLEGIFEAERGKMNTERARNKTEITAMKKTVDEAEEKCNALREDLSKHESHWRSERANQERELSSLKRQLQAMGRDGEGSGEENSSRRSSVDISTNAAEKSSSVEVENALTVELRKQIGQAEKKIGEYTKEIENLKIANIDMKNDLDKVKAQWTKDKEAFTHKSRQTDKIRSVEMDALQQKFSSRMRIMEDTNKSLHSQLVLARRARDSHKDEASQMETRLNEERRRLEGAEKGVAESTAKVVQLQKKLVDIEAEMERTATELRLTKEAKKADQILWSLEKGSKSRPLPSSSSSDKAEREKAEAVRVQYAEYEKFYAKEVERLNHRVKEMSTEAMAKQTESQKIIRELREQIRLLEIDKRNLSDTKESGAAAREMLEAEQSRLQQAVHMAELQKLTRKYRLSSIIDQLQYVSDTRRGHRLEMDHPDSIRYIINQLGALRDEDSNNGGNNERDDRSIATNASIMRDDTYDNISQSSMSIRSTTSAAQIHHNMRFPTVITNGTNGHANGNCSSSNGYANGHVQQAMQQQQRSRHDRSIAHTISQASIPPPPERPPPRANSVENGNWDGASISSRSRKISYPDPPPSFLINGHAPSPTSDKAASYAYDEQGRLIVNRNGSQGVNPLSRSTSFDRRPAPLASPEEPLHFRTSSAGSNILYQVRREELARGGQPSVRLMAQAFESFDGQKPKPKRGLFGVKKSQSVDTQAHERQSTTGSVSTNNSAVTMDELSMATLPRGGRNPFKTMGTKIVERVRRSLSRTSRRDSRERSETAPPSEMSELPRDASISKPAKVDKSSEKGSSSPKKTKKKAAESKARKLNGGN